MEQPHSNPPNPPTEVWWERELYRSEKISDEEWLAESGLLECEDDDFPAREIPDDEHQRYAKIAEQALSFALRIMQLENTAAEVPILCLSVQKISAHLADGHGLGYEDHTICGNIVKCRWALSDAQFCFEMLEFLKKQTRDRAIPELMTDCLELKNSISARIDHLRHRVWW